MPVNGPLFENSFYVDGLEVNGDAFSECFGGKYVRFIITAYDENMLRFAAERTVAPPETVIGRPEGGIECYLLPDETPDGRPGALVQLWMGKDTPKDQFEREISYKLRQGALVVPGIEIYNACEAPRELYDTMETVGYCADGFQEVVDRNERRMIKVPIMVPDFYIEEVLGVGHGVSGGNLWSFVDDSRPVAEVMSELWDETRHTMGNTPKAIASFGPICSAGSKVGSIMADEFAGTPEGDAYKVLGPSTNERWCPSLKDKIDNSLVPDGIVSIPEIVINGVDEDAVKDAMRKIIYTVANIDGIVAVNAGDYGGKLGKYPIYLKDLGLN